MFMQNKALSIGVLAFAMILIGGGCAKVEQPTPASDTEANTKAAVTEQASAAATTGNLTLSAYALEKEGQVRLTWGVPSDLESAEGYRIVRSGKYPGAVYPGNHWFHQKTDARSVTWVGVPAGTQHFRICQFTNGKCTAYSNSVAVDVNGTSGAAGFSTADSAVRAFYNALMSGDKSTALNYVPTSVRNTAQFQRKWKKIQDWQFVNAEVRATQETGDNFTQKNVDVVLGIRINDKIEVATDQATADYRNGKWYLIDFPT
jgi:hypothetical protein